MRRLLKLFVFAVIILLLLYVGLVIGSVLTKPEIEVPTYNKRSGTAIVITGAASRIVQEAALLEHLHETGWLNDVCFISGSSSGALNAVMLNAILVNKISWEQYFSILFNLKDADIFIREGRSLPVNNQPFHDLLTRIIIDSLNYRQLGDLPFHTSISISDISALPPRSNTYRLCNIKINTESNTGFDLIETLMATSSIPFIFPAAKFTDPHGLPNSSFVDGGLADDHLPFTAVLQYEKYRHYGVDTLIIVSRKSDTKPDLNNEIEHFGNKDSKVSEKLNLWLENIAKTGFIKSMKELQKKYPELATHTYVYIPDFPQNFPLLNFNHLKDQYDVSFAWAQTHKPVPLYQYIAENAKVDKH
jgi:predicted acylesterase/phospholipase RssA